MSEVGSPDSCLDKSRGCVIVMAKAPEPGRVKTRMQPQLSEQQSMALYCDLLETVITQLQSLSLPLRLQVSAEHPWFERFSLPVFLQCDGDLGARMAHAAQQGLQHYDWVILLGADCPFIDVDYLQLAIGGLQQGAQAVVGPASDGGYVLLGLRAIDAHLFTGMRWGGDEVMRDTAERLNTLGWCWQLLPQRDDIDRAADLQKLQSHPRLMQWAYAGSEYG